MTLTIDHIKRLMGWCPNTSTIDARKSVQFDDMIINAPDSGGKLTQIAARWRTNIATLF